MASKICDIENQKITAIILIGVTIEITVIVLIVGNVVKQLKCNAYDQRGLGPKLTYTILLCP